MYLSFSLHSTSVAFAPLLDFLSRWKFSLKRVPMKPRAEFTKRAGTPCLTTCELSSHLPGRRTRDLLRTSVPTIQETWVCNGHWDKFCVFRATLLTQSPSFATHLRRGKLPGVKSIEQADAFWDD